MKRRVGAWPVLIFSLVAGCAKVIGAEFDDLKPRESSGGPGGSGGSGEAGSMAEGGFAILNSLVASAIHDEDP